MSNHIVPQFIKKPANKNSISQRKLLYGVGINDADYVVHQKNTGNNLRCPFYAVWANMMMRCFNKKYQVRQKTYIGCTVSKEWLKFSNFRKWMETQDWKNKALDKDIINIANKHYSAKNCVFVSRKINSLIISTKSRRGEYPIGVRFDKRRNSFSATCKVDNKDKYLGPFNTKEKASQAYKTFKSNHITEIANQQTDIRIKNGLLLHAKLIGDNYATI